MNDAPLPADRTPALDLPLSEIPERTKDFLLALAATGKPVTAAIVETLEQAADAAGFPPQRAA